MRYGHAILVLTGLASCWAGLAGASDGKDAPEKTWLGPYCACWSTEPAMGFGGRTLVSIQGAVSGAASRTTTVRKRPALTAAWEFPMALVLLLAQHEVLGHGGRAREYDLEPSYGFGLDLSAYTSIATPPENNVQNITLATGGTEATGVLAHRIQIDLFRPGGGEASLVPLQFLTKLDLSLYAAILEEPRPTSSGDETFAEQYQEGNDMAFYLVARQALRVGADPVEVWERDYTIDFGDRLLTDNYDAVRITAIWNLLDPALVSSVYAYFKRHTRKGDIRITPPSLRVGDRVGLSVGTRGTLGVAEVSRFLDFYVLSNYGVGSVYVRDLDSSIDRTYGFGVGLHEFEVAGGVVVGLQTDWWDNPDSAETPGSGSAWNASFEIDWMVRRRWGFSALVGSKEEGFLQGLPIDAGPYFGFGVLVAF